MVVHQHVAKCPHAQTLAMRLLPGTEANEDQIGDYKREISSKTMNLEMKNQQHAHPSILVKP
jgi:hypothetical protein